MESRLLAPGRGGPSGDAGVDPIAKSSRDTANFFACMLGFKLFSNNVSAISIRSLLSLVAASTISSQIVQNEL